MTVQSYDIRHPDAGFFTRLGERLGSYIERIGERHAEDSRLRQLLELDDRTLKDIGLTRAELSAVAHNPGDQARARNC